MSKRRRNIGDLPGKVKRFRPICLPPDFRLYAGPARMFNWFVKAVFSAVVAVALLCGCSPVYIEQPAGSGPRDISKNELDGTWLLGDLALAVSVMDATNGLLNIGWIENNNGAFLLRTAEVLIRKHGCWDFANLLDDEETNGVRYSWGRLGINNGLVMFWCPDEDAFKDLVERGIVPGNTNSGKVVLSGLDTNALDFIMSGTNGFLFEWNEPLIFRKVKP